MRWRRHCNKERKKMKNELGIAVIKESYLQNLIEKLVLLWGVFSFSYPSAHRWESANRLVIKSQIVAIFNLDASKQLSHLHLFFFCISFRAIFFLFLLGDSIRRVQYLINNVNINIKDIRFCLYSHNGIFVTKKCFGPGLVCGLLYANCFEMSNNTTNRECVGHLNFCVFSFFLFIQFNKLFFLCLPAYQWLSIRNFFFSFIQKRFLFFFLSFFLQILNTS